MEKTEVEEFQPGATTWGDEEPLDSFLCKSNAIYTASEVPQILSNCFFDEITYPDTELRPDGIVVANNSSLYYKEREATADATENTAITLSNVRWHENKIKHIPKTAGLYGYTYGEKKLTLYCLKDIAAPKVIWTIIECPFSENPFDKKNRRRDIVSCGQYLFIEKKKSIDLSQIEEKTTVYDDLPDTYAIQFLDKTYIVPGASTQASAQLVSNAITISDNTRETCSFGIPFRINGQEFFLLRTHAHCTNDNYLVAQASENSLKKIFSLNDGIQEARLAATGITNPCVSFYENKLFFMIYDNSKRPVCGPGFCRGFLYAFDGKDLLKEGVIETPYLYKNILFLKEKLILWEENGYAMQFRRIVPKTVAQKKAVELFFEEKSLENSDSAIHDEYRIISKKSYIRQAIPNFFNKTLFKSDRYYFLIEQYRYDHMIHFLKQVHAVRDIIDQYPHKNILKTAIKELFCLGYGPIVISGLRKMTRLKTADLTADLEELQEQKETLSFLFDPPLKHMLKYNQKTPRFASLSAIYLKNRPVQRPLYSAYLERTLNTQPLISGTRQNIPQIEWAVD